MEPVKVLVVMASEKTLRTKYCVSLLPDQRTSSRTINLCSKSAKQPRHKWGQVNVQGEVQGAGMSGGRRENRGQREDHRCPLSLGRRRVGVRRADAEVPRPPSRPQRRGHLPGEQQVLHAVRPGSGPHTPCPDRSLLCRVRSGRAAS